MAVMHSLAHIMGCWWHSSTFCLVLLCFIPLFLFDSTLGMPYRADWEPEAPSGRRVLGVFWRYPAVLWGPSTPNPTQVS